jgi:hypothetical protein
MNTFVICGMTLLILILFDKILLLKYVSLHTRQRFAFCCIGAAMTMAMPFIYQAFSPGGIVRVTFETCWVKVDAQISTELDYGCLCLAFGVLVLMLWFMVYIFKNWDSQKGEHCKKEKTRRLNKMHKYRF